MLRFGSVRQKAALVAACLCTLVALPVSADVTDGQFIVRSAHSQVLDGVYYVTAQIDYGLTQGAIDALHSAVPLTFNLNIEVNRERRFFMDASLAELRQRYELTFHALTERYLVTNLNSGEQRTFGTLASALRGLGTIERMPVIDASLLDEDRSYTISMRSTLDVKSFSGPLRLLATLFRFKDWRLASKWHTWALNP